MQAFHQVECVKEQLLSNLSALKTFELSMQKTGCMKKR